MLISNITTIGEGQKHFLGEEKLKGAVLENLFGMFTYFSKNAIFDFISNFLANISALKEGREYMITNKMLSKILELLK